MFYDTNENGQVAAIMRDDPTVAIAAERLGKCYEIFDRPADRLKQMLLRRSLGRPFWALQDVSFTVRKGEALGVVGHNGAGKSTLLQILAGALKPTTGEALLRGRVASLLELGSGFLPDFTGRENVFVNGTALGLSTREVEQRLDEIRDFAEIGEFFDQPVKTYSSGMFVRLAFAVQACLSPDILIVDEALAVGDIFFQQKCHAHMAGLLDKGVAILLVTHDVQAVRKYCSSVILLENGRVTHQGEVETGLRLYLNRISSAARSSFEASSPQPDVSPNEAQACQNSLAFWPDTEAFFDLSQATTIENVHNTVRVDALGMCDKHGRSCRNFGQNEKAVVYAQITAMQDLQQIVAGITLWTADNVPVYCLSSLQAHGNLPIRIARGASIQMSWAIDLALARGPYTLTFNLSEYPEWTASQLDHISTEMFFSLGTPLVGLTKVGPFFVVEPLLGIKFPFTGLTHLTTEVHACLIDPASE